MHKQARLTVSLLITSVLALLLFVAGCGSIEEEQPTGSVVIGLTSELRVPTDIQELHVVMRVNGAVVREETRGSFAGAPAPLSFPAEIPFGDLEEGDRVEVELEAFGGEELRLLLATRRAATQVVAGRKLLMRVRLDTKCAPSGGMSVSCGAEQTCIGGTCRDVFISPQSLEVYTPGWSDEGTDVCKPGGGAAPIVIVGKGQSDYLPLEDLEVAQVEAGPQGGHHIWVAVRMKNLRQSGSITSVSGFVPDLNLEISPFNVIFTFDPDEGGYCKLYGLRFQLDTNGNDIQSLLGHKLEVTVRVTESKGDAVGVGERTVTLSDTIL